MPRNNDLRKILLIGSGPIVIGQGPEFDYSGVQACKALKEEGYEVVLVNSNPATIMTDPEFADRTYIEPITPEVIEKILEREKPDAILPTMGGQTALNVAMELNRNGALIRHHVRLIGANAAAIAKGEDRQLFKEAMLRIGLDVPRSGIARCSLDEVEAIKAAVAESLAAASARQLRGFHVESDDSRYKEEVKTRVVAAAADAARKVAEQIGTFPLILRPAFTLGGSGGGIAYNRQEFDEIVATGLNLSPVHEVLIEESLLGWKEFEMEVMRDCADNCVVVCSIENLDPMGVHTGDSITVAPTQTLSDREYQLMRDASFAVIREIGVETGGSNIQFAVNPENGRMVVIEMNPRVSRSSALASKATGFPIAKIAAKLAVGYTLDEIRNDITRETPASFEPTIDYCVVKVPRFTFEKFPQADPVLTTQMKSVGEAMAIGRTFKEALQKALRSLEIKRFGLIGDGNEKRVDADTLRLRLTSPNAERIFYVAQAFQDGMTIDDIFELTKIDPWFLQNIRQIVEEAAKLRASAVPGSTAVPAVRRAGVSPAEPAASKAVFRGFDEHGEVSQTRRNLPHWQQSGATYFVTFRLADSVSASLRKQWEDEFAAWARHHPKPWDAPTAYEYQQRFIESREMWLDRGHGACLLRVRETAELVASALRHFDGERYVLDGFVVMPNHVHVLVQPVGEHSLSDILHSWKSFTAHQIERSGHSEPLWQAENFDRIVRGWEELLEYRRYIVRNPEKAGLRDGEFVLESNWKLLEHEPAGETPAVRTAETAVLRHAAAAETDAVEFDASTVRRLKKLGFSDRQLAVAWEMPEAEIRALRKSLGVIPTYRLVDTCAAEFEAFTPYYYSTYGTENEMRRTNRRKIMILGGGPNRIGQGIEFDYCCVHAAFALRELGFETIMVNSNPETVSTDYDTSDKLYFEPLTLEDVLNIYDQEQPEGVIVQFGGQTPLNLAAGLRATGVPILGTQPESIEKAEDRKLFAAMLDKLGLRQTPSGSAVSADEAVAIAQKVGYPVLVRPSFVLGGRAMELVYNDADLHRYMKTAIEVSPDRPVLVDRFLEDAIEVDVDCICDGKTAVVGAIMEHIEQAGIHSGDSACAIPTFSLSENVLHEISTATKAMARELEVRGLMNVQFAVKDECVYVLEVNPRASRTIPFVSKAIGVPLAKMAAKVMTGASLHELGFTDEIIPEHFSVKEAVFPFLRYQGADIALGPEMKSTGEVMGIDVDLGLAFAKSQMAAQPSLPAAGNVFISVKDVDKERVIPIAREFVGLNFGIISTSGTATALAAAGIPVTKVFKLREGRPNVLDRVKNGDINFIINTPSGKIPREDEVTIRNASLARRIPIMTTIRAAWASANGIRSLQRRGVTVKSLQEYHATVGPVAAAAAGAL
jgi:carbamoylphosphate synthase large subunit/REP element-mobilizing transposase RayT